MCVSYICSGPQLLNNHLYSVHHLLPHSCLFWPGRHEVVEVHHLLVESAGGRRMKDWGYSHQINTHTTQASMKYELWAQCLVWNVTFDLMYFKFLIAKVNTTNSHEDRVGLHFWEKTTLQMAQDRFPSYRCSGEPPSSTSQTCKTMAQYVQVEVLHSFCFLIFCWTWGI